MGLFYGFVANSMSKNFTIPEVGYLTPYTALVFFSIGIFFSNFVLNTIIMRWPFEGKPVAFYNYLHGSARNHFMGILGGIIWCVGMSFSIIPLCAAAVLRIAYWLLLFVPVRMSSSLSICWSTLSGNSSSCTTS